MSRVSKGKLKHLWSLYAVWDIVRTRRWTILFSEPGKELTACLAGTIIRKFTAEERGFFDQWTTGVLGHPISEQLTKKDEPVTLTGQLFSKLESLGGDEWLRRQLDDLKTRNPDDFQHRFQRQRIEPETFLRKVAEKGYYDGCRKLNHDLDLEMFVHVARTNNPTYMTFVRGKHKLKEDGWLEVKCGGYLANNPNGITYATEGLHKEICTDHTVDAFLIANDIDQLKDGGIHG